MESHHETLDHTADTGIRAHAGELSTLFEECAVAMFAVTYGELDTAAQAEIDVAVAAGSVEELLVAWLSELLAVAEIEDLALTSFAVDELTQRSLRGRTGGVPVAGASLAGPPIKAVTYHDLQVVEDSAGWHATVIFDL